MLWSGVPGSLVGAEISVADRRLLMRARELARPFPILPLDAPASEVGRLLAAEAVGVVFLQDASGGLDGAVTDTRLLWFLLATAYRDVPEIDGDANLVEVAALLCRTRAPVAAVRDAGRLLGGITTSALLARLLGGR